MQLKTLLKTTAISALVLTFSCANNIYSPIVVKADDEKPAMNVEYHSKEEVINYYNNNPYDVNMETTYEVQPIVTPPYSAGMISSDVLQNAQTMVNFVRYTAGLSSMVHIEEYYNQISQAASLCNYVNRSLSHYPAQPEDMDEDLYNLAAEGASSANIAMATGRLTLPETIKMYLDDGDSGNISRVGHRRWILYPQLSGIGFGQVGGYSATNVINNSRNNSADEYGVAWPAQNTPIELLYNWSSTVANYPWSITFGQKVSDNVNVRLTNLNTGDTWSFSNDYADGQFYINNGGYGQTGCVIFSPQSLVLNNGDSFKVDINNIGIDDYQDSLTYYVNIFSLDDKNGLCLSDNGVWNYYNNGNIDYNYTGLASNQYGWWYVENGAVNFDYTGLVQNEYGWWYVSGGRVAFEHTGLVQNEFGWWYVQGGQVAFDYTGLVENEFGWWYIAGGKVIFDYTGLVQNEFGWWYIAGGKVIFEHTGLVQNEYGWWYIAGGKVIFEHTGLVQNEYGWWYVQDGKVNFDYTGLVQNEYGVWYIVAGGIDFNYTGSVTNEYGTWSVVNGRVE